MPTQSLQHLDVVVDFERTVEVEQKFGFVVSHRHFYGRTKDRYSSCHVRKHYLIPSFSVDHDERQVEYGILGGSSLRSETLKCFIIDLLISVISLLFSKLFC